MNIDPKLHMYKKNNMAKLVNFLEPNKRMPVKEDNSKTKRASSNKTKPNAGENKAHKNK